MLYSGYLHVYFIIIDQVILLNCRNHMPCYKSWVNCKSNMFSRRNLCSPILYFFTFLQRRKYFFTFFLRKKVFILVLNRLLHVYFVFSIHSVIHFNFALFTDVETVSPVRFLIAVLAPVLITRWGQKRGSLDKSGAVAGNNYTYKSLPC